MRPRAFAVVEIVLVLALLGGVAWAAFPGVFSGASRRAKASTNATANLETATTNRDATAAASVVKIGEANGLAPESPSKAFIRQEVPVALSLLPQPDAMALIEAERRKAAVMEGRADEARRLYEGASKRAAELQAERDHALAARQAADLALEQAAAADHAKSVQLLGAAIVAVLALAGWIYVKLFSIGPHTVGEALADIKSGADPVAAFSSALAPRLHARVRKARKENEPD